ncbi:MAG: hypothetical protein ACRDYC_13060, partial [Acidimicrobiales bacterium]
HHFQNWCGAGREGRVWTLGGECLKSGFGGYKALVKRTRVEAQMGGGLCAVECLESRLSISQPIQQAGNISEDYRDYRREGLTCVVSRRPPL